MTNYQLNRLNEILADKLGRVPAGYPESGQSRYQFKRLKDLVFPARAGAAASEQPSGLVLVLPNYEMQQQYPGEPDCWAIARWVPPGWDPGSPDGAFGEMGEPKLLTPEQWDAKFGDSMAFPQHGWWFVVVPLKPRYSPDEKWTRWAADHLDWQGSLGLRQTFNLIMQRRAKRDEAHRVDVVDSLRECWVNHVPGARGGSYLAFNEGKDSSV